MKDIDEIGLCAICFHHYLRFGNNPQPVLHKVTERVCNDCNMMFVLPARLGAGNAVTAAKKYRSAQKRAFNKAMKSNLEDGRKSHA